MTGVIRYLLAALLAVSVLAGHATAQQMADNVGPLQVPLEDDGRWKVENRSGWLLMTNRADAGLIRLYSDERQPLTTGTRTLRANVLVRGEGDRPSFAGLAFSRISANNFLAALIRKDGALVWMNHSPNKTDFTVSEDVRARMDGTDILEVRETPGRVEILLNGAEGFSLTSQDGFIPSYGITAIGMGRFGFDAFEIAEEGVTPGADRREIPRRDDPEPERGDRVPPGPWGQGTPEQIKRAQVLLGVTMGVLFHEFGHALIGETKLPATGPEEDVADGFSAFVMTAMIQEDTSPEAIAFLSGVIRNAGLLWYHSAKLKERRGLEASWQGEHAPDIRRFRNIFCIIYGSNPQLYEGLATHLDVKIETRQRCLQEFAKRYAAWETLLQLVSRNLGPDLPGKLPADAPGGRIILKIQPPTSQIGKDVVQMLEGTDRTLTQMFGFLEKTVVWPNDVTVEFKQCPGMPPNAWYDPTQNSVTMCYEVIEMFSKIIFEGEPLAPASAPAVDPAQYMPGKWLARLQGAQGQTVDIGFTFRNDGSYRATINAGQMNSWTEGTWQAAMTPEGLIELKMNPEQWEPKQICDANGANCQSNTPARETVLVKVIDQNAFGSSGLNFKRAQ